MWSSNQATHQRVVSPSITPRGRSKSRASRSTQIVRGRFVHQREHQKHARPSLIANFSFVIGYSFRNDPSDIRCILSTYLGLSMFKVTTPSLGCVVSTGGGAPTRKKQKKVLIFCILYLMFFKKTELKLCNIRGLLYTRIFIYEESGRLRVQRVS